MTPRVPGAADTNAKPAAPARTPARRAKRPATRRSRAQSPTAKPAAAEPSPAERAELGKAARRAVPRRSHGEWEPATKRADPVALLEEQAESRVPELVPIRYGRMATSPFAFFRGAAYVMAADLSETPTSGTRVQLCGDAHLSNFGGFASPERDLLFDLNDFDETLPGPWEWDVKRLVTSLEIAGRERGLQKRERRAAVRGAVRQYREAIRAFASMTRLEVWYSRMDRGMLEAAARAEVTAHQDERLQKLEAKARTKDSFKAFNKLTRIVDGEPRIVSDPPLIVPVEELVPAAEAARFAEAMESLILSYKATMQGDRRSLLDRYRAVEVARKVVGVGSVGTRCWVILLIGRDSGDPLFLQCKEAPPSVLARFAGATEFDNNGQRVVEGQRMMQAASDIFLGWLHNEGGLDGVARDFYVRQLWDWKVSADITTMPAQNVALYAGMCAWTLARAHARSGDAIAIGAYLGSGEEFDKALTTFAERYADQNERDHEALLAAIKSGRVQAVSDL
jgi:uncharacterized protein (DUF2252 family)